MVDDKVSAANIIIEDRAFEFLRLQKGKLEPLARNRKAWEAAYRESLDRDYQSIRQYLPKKGDGIDQIIDVGSGLGGIDIMLHRHYNGQVVPLLMDGVKDPAVMTLHRKTYNSADIAERFHNNNGVIPVSFIDANMRPLLPISYPAFLVISLGSWCFHYEPKTYLAYIKESIRKDAVLILDVRKTKPEWKNELGNAFTWKAVVHSSDKFDRCVYVNA